MKIEIRATYAATDGRLPEDVSVEIEHDAQGLTLTSVVTEILPLLDRMLAMPAARDMTRAWAGIKGTLTGVQPIEPYVPDGRSAPVSSSERLDMPAEVLNERCRRLQCGHYRFNHLDIDAGGGEPGPYLGRCVVCDDPGHCESFIGSDANMPGGGKS